MSNAFLADVIVVVHFSWVAFVVLGQLAILVGMALGWGWVRSFAFRYVHLSMMAIVVVEVLFGITCPLTVWEKRLRGFGRNDTLAYTDNDSFIARKLGEILFAGADLDGGSWPFVVGYVGFFAIVVGSFLYAPPRMRMSAGAFVALVHATVGAVLLATVPQFPGIGAFLLAEAWLWRRLTRPTPASG